MWSQLFAIGNPDDLGESLPRLTQFLPPRLLLSLLPQKTLHGVGDVGFVHFPCSRAGLLAAQPRGFCPFAIYFASTLDGGCHTP